MENLNIKNDLLAIEPKNSPTSGNVFVASPDKKTGAKLGVLFGLTALEGMALDFEESFFEIIEDLQTEYYLPPLETENGVERRFEEALQRANRRIGRLIQNSVERVELKNINTLIGLLHRDQLYLSQIGRTNAFLFHFQKGYHYSIIDIFDQSGTKRQKANEEKMFSNVVSGEISDLDQMFFANDNILAYISVSELSEIVTSYEPREAHRQIGADLVEQSDKETFYSIIIKPEITKNRNETAEVIKDELPPNDKINHDQGDRSDTSIRKLLATQRETEEYLTPSLMPSWQKAIILILVGIKKGIAIVYYHSKKLFTKSFKKNNRKKDKSTKEEKTKKEISEGKNIQSDEEKTSPKIPSPEKDEDATPSTFPRKGIFAILNRWLNDQIKKFFELKKLQQIMLIVFFIAVFLFSQSIVIIGKKESVAEKVDVQSVIDEAREAINVAEARNIFNDEDGANNAIIKAQELISQIPDDKKYTEAKSEIEDRINKLNQLLQKITYLENPTVIANLSEKNSKANTKGLIAIADNLFTYDNQSHTLYKIDLTQKQIISLPLSEEIGNIKKIVKLDDNNLIILSADNNFYQYQIAENILEKVLSPNTEIADFDIYANKIYSLQPTNNQIFKHTRGSVGFNKGSAWITGGTIDGGKSLVIDGGIFVNQDNGLIKYFLRGQEKETNFAIVNPPLNNAIQLVTTGDSDYLYVLDQTNQRIIIFNKDGELQTQYMSKKFGEVENIVVDETKNQIDLLAGNKIYQIDIDF